MANQKTAFVTGANGGIGVAITKQLLDAGHHVYAQYRSDDSSLKPLASKNLTLVKGELGSSSDVDAIISQLSNIDILVNCAGAYEKSPSFGEIPIESFNDILNINVSIPFYLSQKLLPGMKKNKWGRIINISSCTVKHGGNSASISYTVSKRALEQLTISLAKECAASNILVNAVRVGVTDTKFHQKNSDKDMAKRIEMIGLKRMASPDEIADAVSYLASDKSSFITGSILDVDGGEF